MTFLVLYRNNCFSLTMTDLSFEENDTGKFIRIRLKGGKTVMTNQNPKNDRIITPNDNESCLYALTKR